LIFWIGALRLLLDVLPDERCH
jgi:hypothetical protein